MDDVESEIRSWLNQWSLPSADGDALVAIVQDLLAAERAAATAAAVGACAEAIPGGTKKGVEYRARIRALSPEGWVAIPTPLARILLDVAMDFRDMHEANGGLPATNTRAAIAALRAALARGKGE